MTTRGKKKKQEQMKNSNQPKNLENSRKVYLLNLPSRDREVGQERMYLQILKIPPLKQKERDVDQGNK